MKKNLFYVLVPFFILTACSTEDVLEDRQTEGSRNDVYVFESIKYLLAEEDGVIDSVWCKTDTILEYNLSDYPQPDKVFYPYEAVRDSSVFIVEDNIVNGKKIVLPDSVEAPTLIMNSVIFFSADSPFICKFPGISLKKGGCADTNYKLSITPRTRYAIAGKYLKIRNQASFILTYKSTESGKSIQIKGKWYGVRSERTSGSVTANSI
jgi:hypothetical protein